MFGRKFERYFYQKPTFWKVWKVYGLFIHDFILKPNDQNELNFIWISVILVKYYKYIIFI